MDNFKFILISIIILASIGILGYWAFMTIEPGDVHAYKQAQIELERENKALKEEVEELKSQLGVFLAEEKPAVDPEPSDEPEPARPVPSGQHADLIGELQDLVNDDIFMKVGSRGTRVGTVQKFLNIYNKTSKTVDNVYGPGTKTDVASFQKTVGLSADGLAGPATYQKMIDWLRKQ